jgi:8-oxo-dGTP diphosphatase
MIPLAALCPDLLPHADLPEIHYVVGFVFDPDLQRIVLIRKNRPAHLAGLLNGPGGKVDPGETAVEAMTRELREETGLNAFDNLWFPFATGRGVEADLSSRFRIDFFAITLASAERARTLTDEEVTVVDVWDVPRLVEAGETPHNLGWLVALAIDHLQDGRPVYTTICY